MSESNELAATGQSEFVFHGLQTVNRNGPRWHSNARLFRKHRPEVYRIAVDLLGAGRHSRRDLCELLHVSAHTLEAVEDECAADLATLREKAAVRNMRIHHLSLDRLEELVPTMMDGAKVAVVAGITGDKSQNFAGEATSRIEHIESVNVVERMRAFVGELEKRVQARVMDSEAKNKGANGTDSMKLLESTKPATDGT